MQDAGSIALLKVTVIFLLRATLVAVSAGFVELTVGAVVSAGAPPTKLPPHPAIKMARNKVANNVL